MLAMSATNKVGSIGHHIIVKKNQFVYKYRVNSRRVTKYFEKMKHRDRNERSDAQSIRWTSTGRLYPGARPPIRMSEMKIISVRVKWYDTIKREGLSGLEGEVQV